MNRIITYTDSSCLEMYEKDNMNVWSVFIYFRETRFSIWERDVLYIQFAPSGPLASRLPANWDLI